MKTIMLIITMLLICCINISAQDIEPSQIELRYQNSTFPFSSATAPFQTPPVFLVGYHWTNECSISIGASTNASKRWFSAWKINPTLQRGVESGSTWACPRENKFYFNKEKYVI